jgi:F-type H+-transporting ATPase subunit delta
MTGRLAKRYARALLELTRPANAAEAAGDELTRAAATFDEPRLRAIVLSPAIALDARVKIVDEVVASLGISAIVGNLVRLLARHERLALVGEVARAYETMVDAVLDRGRITIRSAAPLTPAERTDLTDLARRLTGRREILVSTETDPELLGGVVLDTGGTVYDGSIKTQLQRFGRELAGRGA